jgi:hypothetical protein
MKSFMVYTCRILLTSVMMRWAWCEAHTGEKRNAYGFLWKNVKEGGDLEDLYIREHIILSDS